MPPTAAGPGPYFPDQIERILKLDEHARGTGKKGGRCHNGSPKAALRFVRARYHGLNRLPAFPANQTFNVTMGYIGTNGVGGHPAGTVNSGAGGVLTATVSIPAELVDVSPIAVRLQSADGYYSYAWFYNFTFP